VLRQIFRDETDRLVTLFLRVNTAISARHKWACGDFGREPPL
jgi:hypothetical protein